MNNNYQKYLPLTESTAYILLALKEPLHGYGVMQKVEVMSENTVKLGPGTLYGAFSTLEREGLITKAREEERRKLYVLTSVQQIIVNNKDALCVPVRGVAARDAAVGSDG